MRNVRNNQAVKRLSAKSFQASRTRNIIAAAAIALTAILFTAVFTVGLGLIEDTQRGYMLQAGGDAHGVIKKLSQEQYNILKEHPSIVECGRDIVVSYSVDNPEFLKRRVEMHCLDRNLYPHWFIEIEEGKAPEAEDEILLDRKSLELMGVEPKAGCQVTFDMCLHPGSAPVKRTFQVSGVIKSSTAMNTGFAIVSPAYLEAYAGELNRAPEADGEMFYGYTGKISMHVIFSNSRNIQEKLNKIITDSGFTLDMASGDYIDSNANWAYLSESAEGDIGTMAGVGAAVVLIMVTGYLIIYNIFQISVIRDIRYYGLLKTIGTTGRQIKRILRRQAFRLCMLGTPAGLVLGYFAGRFLLPVILAAGKLPDYESVAVSPKPWIFIGAALFTAVTVLISEWKPGRIAARVSPVEALKITEHGKKYKRVKKTTDGGKILRMAFSNLGRNKARTAVVLCSLSLTVVLMNSVYTVTGSIDREGFLSKMILCEDIIGNTAVWNYNYRPFDEETVVEQALSESFISACKEQDSFADGGRIYMVENGQVSMPVESWEIPDYITKNEDGVPGDFWPGAENGFIPYAGYDYGAYLVSVHGIEPFVLSKMTVTEGETDPQAIWEKLETGDYLLYAADVDDDSRVIETEVKHHAGDKITLRYESGREKEYEIVSVVKGHMYSLTNRISSNFSYYVSAEEFQENLSDAYLMSFLLDTKEGRQAEMEEFLKDYTGNVEPVMSYESRTTYEGSFNRILGMITVVGAGLAAMVGLIGMLNFINVMVTSVATRKREFAMMEAIGMTKGQLAGMLTAEGMFYAVLTILLSAFLAVLFSLTAIRGVAGGVWFMRYRFTLLPLAAACPVLLLFGALVPKAVYGLQRKGSIVEELRE